MKKEDSKIKFSFWILIIMLLILVTFSVQNSFLVTVKLLFWQLEIPMAMLIVSTLIIGIVGGMSYSFIKSRAKKDDIIEEVEDVISEDKENEDI